MPRFTHWMATSLAAMLVACGPGTGGTGTGNDVGLADFGAVAASVCGASFADGLLCLPGATGTASGPSSAIDAQGTQTVRFIDSLQGARIVAQFNANSVVLDARCQGLNFAGDWGVTAQGDARYFGSTLQDGSAQRAPTSLAVEGSGAGSAAKLTATLRDGNGRVLLGPITLVPAPATLPAPGPC
ncbi:MAG: hypothetical protein IPP44_14890 [Ideonella sp.]|nr:hypothetical protein [Ideonella sp.]